MPATTPPGEARSSRAELGDKSLGTCAGSPGAPGTHAALGNWSTRIRQLTPQHSDLAPTSRRHWIAAETPVPAPARGSLAALVSP